MFSNPTTIGTPRQLSVFHSEDPLPGIGRLFSQGAYAGALGYLLSVLFSVIANPQAFGPYVVIVVPFVLIYGALFGLIVAVVMWAIIKARGRRVGRLARLALTAAAAFAIFFWGLLFSLGSVANFIQQFLMLAAIVLPVGLITGSRYAPGSAFLHGMRRTALLNRMRPAHRHEFWLGTAISFFFRSLNVLVCVQSFFLLNGNATDLSTSQDLLIVSIIFAYFLLQTVFSFDNAHSLSIVFLTIVANVAGTYAVLEYAQQLDFVKFIIGGYLLLWFVFLMTHWGGMKPLTSHIQKQLEPLLISIKKELRYYYLID